jgi:EmrB/QacA subfamily drug resistance transporter
MTELQGQQRKSADRGGRRSAPPAWAVLLAVCAGQFLVVLDVSVVNVALPSIRADLNLSQTGQQWVVNAYALTFAGFLLLGGRAADLFGRKRTFLTGLALFTAASLAGGLAQSSWTLIAARAVQGLGAAVLAPTTLAILTTSFPEGPERTRAIGTWSAVGAGGGAAGGLIGGLLTDYLSWRWVLLVNVPIGFLVLTCAALWLTESRGVAARLDVPGAVLVTGGVAALAYGIAESESYGWASARSGLPLLAGLLLLAVFTAVEARTAQPLIPLRLFTIRSVSAGNTVLFAVGAATFSTWYFLSLYMQNVLHYTPVRAGLSFLPHTICIIVGSKLAPRLMRRTDARVIVAAGGLMSAAGLAWQSRLTVDGGFLTSVLGPGILTMFGAGLMMTPIAAAATSGVGVGEQGLVSGLLNTSRTLGGALGLTILATSAADRISSRTAAGDGVGQALTSGYSLAFLTGALFVTVGTCLSALLPRPAPRSSV